MAFVVWFLSALMCLAGIGGMIYGVDMLPTERGLAATIASSVALTGAFVTLAIGCVVHKLGKIDTALAWPPEFVAEASAKVKDGASPQAVLAVPKETRPAAAEAKPVAANAADRSPATVSAPEDRITEVLRDDAVALKPSSVEAKRPLVPMATLSELAAIQPVVMPAAVPDKPAETPANPPAAEVQHTAIDFHIPAMLQGAAAAEPKPDPAFVSAPSAAAIAVLTETVRQTASRAHELKESAAPAETGEAARNILDRLRPAGPVVEQTVAAPPRLAPAPPQPAPAQPEPVLPAVAAEPPAALIKMPPVAAPASPRTPAPLPTLSSDADNDPMSNFEAELERLMPLKPVKPRARPRRDRSEPLAGPASEASAPAVAPAPRAFIQLHHPSEPEVPVYILREPDKLDRTPQKPLNAPEQDLAVVGAYESGGSRYTMYSDGSVMAETGGQSLRFTGLDKLKEYMGRSARA